ncbi:MAG: hypothetical protein HY908_16525 [Myxococcales bacterium]|nr:hypothetical protein [Myxococcales bacterium]
MEERLGGGVAVPRSARGVPQGSRPGSAARSGRRGLRSQRQPDLRQSAAAAGLPAAGLPAAGLPAAGLPAAGLPAAGLPAAGAPGDRRQPARAALPGGRWLLDAPVQPADAEVRHAVRQRGRLPAGQRLRGGRLHPRRPGPVGVAREGSRGPPSRARQARRQLCAAGRRCRSPRCVVTAIGIRCVEQGDRS